MAGKFDLFADPVPEVRRKRDRPANIPTGKKQSKIKRLRTNNWNEDEIAKAVGVTRRTLREHYFRKIEDRLMAQAGVDASRTGLPNLVSRTIEFCGTSPSADTSALPVG